jgi:hypothetical protein
VHRLCIIFAAIALAAPAIAQPLAVTYRGTTTLPATTTDQNGTTFTITGLSGITRRTGSGDEFLAVMDNSDKLVRLAVTFNPNSSVASAMVLGGITLSQARDFEGIAFVPPASGPGTVFLAEEGTPAIHEFDLATGTLLRTLPSPAVYFSRRDNFGFESLTRSPLTGDLWTANEEALTTDGPASSTTNGTTVRLLKFVASPGGPFPAQQFAYTTQPIHGSVISGARSGLCDLVALPSGRTLALERSLAFSLTGLFQTRIYELDFSSAVDVSGIATNLAITPVNQVAKRLLYQGSLNNLEGLCIGPRLSANSHALLGIIDDGDPVSVNALVAFELTGPSSCPADFNDDGAVSVQDIFDFLAAYFAAAPTADTDGSGVLSVQDIFDFLAAYFGACE